MAFSLVAGHVVTIGTPACPRTRSTSRWPDAAGRASSPTPRRSAAGSPTLMADFTADPVSFDDADVARVVVIEVVIEELHGKRHPAPKPED